MRKRFRDYDPHHPTGAKKRGRPRKGSHPEGVPEDKAQHNFTDPESHMMKGHAR